MSKIKYIVGEKPGKGCYNCAHCGTHLRIATDDKIPPCPSCNNTIWTKSN